MCGRSQMGAEPLFVFGQGLAGALGVVFELVFAEFADGEIFGVGVK